MYQHFNSLRIPTGTPSFSPPCREGGMRQTICQTPKVRLATPNSRLALKERPHKCIKTTNPCVSPRARSPSLPPEEKEGCVSPASVKLSTPDTRLPTRDWPCRRIPTDIAWSQNHPRPQGYLISKAHLKARTPRVRLSANQDSRYVPTAAQA